MANGNKLQSEKSTVPKQGGRASERERGRERERESIAVLPFRKDDVIPEVLEHDVPTRQVNPPGWARLRNPGEEYGKNTTADKREIGTVGITMFRMFHIWNRRLSPSEEHHQMYALKKGGNGSMYHPEFYLAPFHA